MKHTHDATSGAAGASADEDDGADPLVVLQRLGEELAGLADAVAPERVAGHRVRAITSALTVIERHARGMRLVLRKTAADSGDWKAKGHKSPAEQVAKEEGISVGQAKAEIEASGRLADQPQARDAVANGEISPESAAAVAAGAAADPSAESGLVRSAKRGDLRATQKRAREVIARADERSGQQAKRIRDRRSLRAWVSLDGEGHGVWNIPAESQARVLAALEPYRRAAFAAARSAGQRLSEEQLMADALDMLARDVLLDHDADAADAPSPEGGTAPGDPAAGQDDPSGAPPVGSGPRPAGPDARTSPAHGTRAPSLFDPPTEPAAGGPDGPAPASSPPGASSTAPPSSRPRVVPMAGRRPFTPAPRNRRAPAQVHVLVDFDALARGFAAEGEVCEIHGVGPVPVGLARHLMQDAILRLIVTGTDITKVTSQRRYVPEEVRRALFARDKGTCVVPGCGCTKYLELHHHTSDFADGCPTEYATLAHVCTRDHALLTHCGWTLHRTDDGWDMRPPASDTGPDPP